MDEIGRALSAYGREVADIASSPDSTEATYYPFDHLRGIVHRLAALLRSHKELDHAYDRAIELPFSAEDVGF